MKMIELALLFLSAMIAGGWMATMMVFARGYKRLSPAAYIEVEQTNSRLACMYFAPMLVVTVLTGVGFLIKHGDASSHAFLLSAIGTGLLAVTAVFVKIKVLPINDMIKQWSPATPPANWQAVRTKWIHYHNIRTATGVTAFVLQAVAIIWK
jgi:uncharacterized membrane protein